MLPDLQWEHGDMEKKVVGSMTEDDLNEEMVRDLIERHLNEENCANVMAWLDKRVMAYEVLEQLKDELGMKPLSYEKIASTASERLLRLAKSGLLTDGDVARIKHWDRFLQRIANSMPNPNLKAQDVLTEEELQKLFQETAEPGTDVGKCPLLH